MENCEITQKVLLKPEDADPTALGKQLLDEKNHNKYSFKEILAHIRNVGIAKPYLAIKVLKEHRRLCGDLINRYVD